MKNDRVISIGIAMFAIIMLISYICYGTYQNQILRITTEPAVISEVGEIVKTQAFVVRDEAHMSGSGTNTSILTSSAGGVYVASVKDGSRVAANDNVALSFSSASDAQLYSLLGELDKKLDYYKKIQKQSVLSSVDVDTLDNRINSYISSYIDCIDSGNISDISDIVTELEHNMTTRQIATGTVIDFSAIIKQLQSERAALAAKKPSVKYLSTAHAGFFVSSVDGYESKAKYDTVADLKAKDIDKLLTTEPAGVSENAFGKVIGEFDWYLLCCVPDSALSVIETGSYVEVAFEDAGNLKVKMKVKKISESQDGRVALVLSSSVMNEQIARLRIENVSITLKSYKGYKISKSALRQNDDGDMGVYIVYGNSARFRKVTINYYGSNFVMVAVANANDENNVTQLKLHDSIIVKGRELYNGKLLSQ